MTTTELRREWEKAGAIIELMPDDTSGALIELRAECVRLEEYVRRQRNIQRETNRELKAMGAARGRRGRDRIDALERRAAYAAEDEAKLSDAIDRLRQQEAAAQIAKERRDEWLVEHAPSIRRFDALGRELWWREQQQAIAAEVAMPQYLVNAVGERPMRPSERAAWHEAVRAIENYRMRWGVKDNTRSLGGRANKAAQREERDAVKAHLAKLLDRSSSERELEVRERSIEL